MTKTRISRVLLSGIAFGVMALVAFTATDVLAQEGGEVTYARDVAPILQQKCQICHQPNSVAPMSLLTYEEVRRYSARIKSKVETRAMPPFHINRTVGIQSFKNDRGLTEDQIATIVDWVDQGTVYGDAADEPAPIVFPDPNRWQLADQFGEPDLIVRSEPFSLEAVAQDKWFRPTVETGLTEARWVRAIEMRPSYPAGRQVVHHALAFLLQREEGGVTGLASTAADAGVRGDILFMEWAVGKVGEVFAEDAGKLMMPGSQISWEVHLHAMGEEVVDDVVELGVYFYPRGYVPENRTVLNIFQAVDEELDIPPGQVSVTQNFHVMQAPGRLENFQPHMHMRGKAFSMEAIYPDGRKELLSSVDNFQWQWHVNYVYASDVAPLLPKGTTLVFTAWHDNTEDNPNNPDHRQWVGYGDRTVDEMAHAWVDVTYLEQDEFDRQVAARETRPAADQDDDQ
jgi:mono/diheme cytochrome c family protein